MAGIIIMNGWRLDGGDMSFREEQVISPIAQSTLELLSVTLVLSPEQSSRPHGERRIIDHRTQDVAARNDAY